MGESGRSVPARRIASFYRPSLSLGHYVEWKLRLDPAFARLTEIFIGRAQPILDVGCGVGLLGAVLRVAGIRTSVRGFDRDAGKIARARRALGERFDGLSFEPGDAVAPPDFRGDVVALDVLHYLPAACQASALRAWADRVAPGGLLVVRAPLREPGLRTRATEVQEWIIRTSGWVRTGGTSFPRREELLEPGRAAGLEVELRPLWGKTPFNGWLLVGRRPDAP